MATRVTGDRELDRALGNLLPKYQKKVLRPGLRAAAKLIANDLESLTPEDTGQLVLSIRVRAKKRSRVSFGTNIIIGSEDVGGDSPYYAFFVEFGHVAADGTFVAAQPFARPALWDNADEVYRIFITTSRQRLPQVAAEARKA